MSEESRRVLELHDGMKSKAPGTNDHAFASRRYQSASFNLAPQLARQVEALEAKVKRMEAATTLIANHLGVATNSRNTTFSHHRFQVPHGLLFDLLESMDDRNTEPPK